MMKFTFFKGGFFRSYIKTWLLFTVWMSATNLFRNDASSGTTDSLSFIKSLADPVSLIGFASLMILPAALLHKKNPTG